MKFPNKYLRNLKPYKLALYKILDRKYFGKILKKGYYETKKRNHGYTPNALKMGSV